MIADARIEQGSGHRLADRIAASILATVKRRKDWRRIATIVGKLLLSAANDYQPPDDKPETD